MAMKGILRLESSASEDAPALDIAISKFWFLHNKFCSKKNKLFLILFSLYSFLYLLISKPWDNCWVNSILNLLDKLIISFFKYLLKNKDAWLPPIISIFKTSSLSSFFFYIFVKTLV